MEDEEAGPDLYMFRLAKEKEKDEARDMLVQFLVDIFMAKKMRSTKKEYKPFIKIVGKNHENLTKKDKADLVSAVLNADLELHGKQ